MSEVGESLLKGAKEALEFAKGHKKSSRVHKVNIPKKINVRAIRNRLHMTREDFSKEFGFSIRTLEKWERGERIPVGPTRAYLIVISKNPSAVKKALSG